MRNRITEALAAYQARQLDRVLKDAVSNEASGKYLQAVTRIS